MSALTTLSDELEALVAKTTPGVVSVERGRGGGTGILLSKDGYVLTNEHVAGSDGRIGVRFADGERLSAERVGADPQTDLAVLRIETRVVNPLVLAEDRLPAVGQLVVAIGNPLGFERSVSLGMVSAVDRSLPGPRGVLFEGLVQTDAAINPGNSGGPLVNARGEVIGVNTAVLPFAQGMGFAVGARTATWVAAVLIQRGEVHRRYLGVGARTVVLPERIAAQVGQPRAVRVLEVLDDSPAQRAGMKPGDYILGVHGKTVGSMDDMHRLMVLAGSDEVPLQLWRKEQVEYLFVRPMERQRAA
jgi:S1-C subfamily serine protease